MPHRPWFSHAMVFGIALGFTLAATAQPAPAPQSLGLDDLVRLADERHPRLAQAMLAIDAAHGKAVQAGKYPNPMLQVNGEELSDVMGPGGIWTAPFFSQELVTRGKLRLDREAALRDVDRATLGLCVQRFALLTVIRQAYVDVLLLQRRLQILGELVQIAERSTANTEKLIAARQAARLDLVQLEVERERARAEYEATRDELPAAFRRLAAVAGAPDLPFVPLMGSLEIPTPDYAIDSLMQRVRGTHPEITIARVGVDRARILLRRAEVERTPNITIGGGYMRQNQNQSNDWTIALSMPLTLWNRNQGNIRTAQAELGSAVHEIARIENELIERLATSHREYAAARRKAENYRVKVLPPAKEAYDLSVRAFQGGQFDYLKVLQAQRVMSEANLEAIKVAGEAWKAAAAIAGLLLEEQWPVLPR